MSITGYNKVSNGYIPIIERRTLLCQEEMELARWVTKKKRVDKWAVVLMLRGRLASRMVADVIFTVDYGMEHAVILLPLIGTR